MGPVHLKHRSIPHETFAGGTYADIVEAIGNTPLVELQRLSPKPGVRIWAKLESRNPTGSVKDRVAQALIEDAEAKGADRARADDPRADLGQHRHRAGDDLPRKGYRLKVVMPDNVTPSAPSCCSMYGAEIVYSRGAQGSNGAVEMAVEMAEEDPSYYMPYQYGNPANPMRALQRHRRSRSSTSSTAGRRRSSRASAPAAR